MRRYLNLSEERVRLTKERSCLQERLRRLQELYLDEYPEQEYRREKETLLAGLRSLGDVVEDEVLIQGDNVEGLVDAWPHATPEERRDIVRTMLEAISVDVPNKAVVALDVKPAFRPLFRAWIENSKPEVPLRFENLVHGDPEGIRGLQQLSSRLAALFEARALVCFYPA